MKIQKALLFGLISIVYIGCDMPLCHEGEMICTAQFDANTKSYVPGIDGAGKPTGIVFHSSICETGTCIESQPIGCHLFTCSANNYIKNSEKSCLRGSKLIESTINRLECIPECEPGDMECRIDNVAVHAVYQGVESGQDHSQACDLFICQNNKTYPEQANIECPTGSRIINDTMGKRLECIPECEIGETVCIDLNDQKTIRHSNNTKSEHYSMNNNQPCRINYCFSDGITLGETCNKGSRLSDKLLTCIPECEPGNLRCNINTAKVQICAIISNTYKWTDNEVCNNVSCKCDNASGIDENDYCIGTCGECKNGDAYCEYDGNDILNHVTCENGTLNRTMTEACTATSMLCGDELVNYQNDANHCGKCNHACTGLNTFCIDGSCQQCNAEGYDNSGAYCIKSAEMLKELHAKLSEGQAYPDNNNKMNSYVLVNDIEFTDEWSPLGTRENPITIQFNGNGHKITFKKNIHGKSDVGIFGALQDSLIQSLKLKATIQNDDPVPLDETNRLQKPFELPATGGIVGYMENTTIQDVDLNINVTGHTNVGGIAGIAISSKIINTDSGSKVSGSVKSVMRTMHNEKFLYQEDYNIPFDGFVTSQPPIANMGGVAGYISETTINNITSNVDITSLDNLPLTNVGGIIGMAKNNNSINTCSHNSDIKIAGYRIGGLIGYVQSNGSKRKTTIMNSRVSRTSLNDALTIDTIFGFAKNDDRFQDIVYHLTNPPGFTITNKIITPSDSVGGLVGEVSGSISLFQNDVNITMKAFQRIGGYIGHLEGRAEIDGCKTSEDTNSCSDYSSHNVTISGNNQVGGFIGSISNLSNPSIYTFDLNIENTNDANVTINISVSSEDLPNNYALLYNNYYPVDFEAKIGGIAGYTGNNRKVFISKHSKAKLTIDDNNESDTTFYPQNIGGIIGESHGHLFLTDFSVELQKKNEHSIKISNVGGLIGLDLSDEIVIDTTSNNQPNKIHAEFKCSYKEGVDGRPYYQPCGGIIGHFKGKSLFAKNTFIDKLNITTYEFYSDALGGAIGKISTGETSTMPSTPSTITLDSIILRNLNLTNTTNISSSSTGGIIGSCTTESNIKMNKIYIDYTNNENYLKGYSAGGVIGSVVSPGNIQLTNSYISQQISGTYNGGFIGQYSNSTQNTLKSSSNIFNTHINTTKINMNTTNSGLIGTGKLSTYSDTQYSFSDSIVISSLKPRNKKSTSFGGIFGMLTNNASTIHPIDIARSYVYLLFDGYTDEYVQGSWRSLKSITYFTSPDQFSGSFQANSELQSPDGNDYYNNITYYQIDVSLVKTTRDTSHQCLISIKDPNNETYNYYFRMRDPTSYNNYFMPFIKKYKAYFESIGEPLSVTCD